jgi:hypothetical protein
LWQTSRIAACWFNWLTHALHSTHTHTLFCVMTTLATPMLTELTTIVAAPRPTIVPPDASSARPSAARAAIWVCVCVAGVAGWWCGWWCVWWLAQQRSVGLRDVRCCCCCC